MRKFPLFTIFLMPLATAAADAATTTYISGSLCADTFEVSLLMWTPSGTVDFDTGDDRRFDRFPTCPMTSWSSSAINGQANAQVYVGAATLVYWDRSSGSFSCYVTVENWDGTLYSSHTLYSCSKYGGCPSDSEPGWQGYGQLNWTAFNLGPLFGVGWYPDEIAIQCKMPGNNSVIRSYNFTTQEHPFGPPN